MHLHLYQIWYDESSKPAQNSGMEAFDCRNNPEFLKREIAHLIRFYDEIVSNSDDDSYFALLSPRFGEKTGLTVSEIKDFVSSNPNHDIYLFNPFPTHTYVDINVWENGESRHPGLKQLTQHLLDTTGIDFDIYALHRNNILNTVYCNYWVASKPFLDDFVNLIKNIDATINTMPKHERDRYFSTARYNTEASYYPFIFERLICTFLLMNPNYSSKPYIYTYPFLGCHKLKPLESKFYFSSHRPYFDEWETNPNNVNRINQGFSIVQNRLRPDVRISSNKVVNRLSNSLLKKLYNITPISIEKKLKNIENNYQSALGK